MRVEVLGVLAGAGFGQVHECLHGLVMVVLALGLLGGQVLEDGLRGLPVDVAVVLGELDQLGYHRFGVLKAHGVLLGLADIISSLRISVQDVQSSSVQEQALIVQPGSLLEVGSHGFSSGGTVVFRQGLPQDRLFHGLGLLHEA